MPSICKRLFNVSTVSEHTVHVHERSADQWFRDALYVKHGSTTIICPGTEEMLCGIGLQGVP